MSGARPRDGFSFVEALVVLAVTSVVLILLFSVSTGATRVGFRVAGRADDTVDRTVGADALRALIRAVRLPERGRSPHAFDGDAEGFRAAAAPDRPSPCGPGAPTSTLNLRLDHAGGRTRLVCGGPGGGVVLLDLGAQTAGFSYALAGRAWTGRLSARLPTEPPGSRPAPAPRARLWIRLAGSGGFEVVDSPDAPPPRRTGA